MGIILKTNFFLTATALGSDGRRINWRRPLKTKLEGDSPGWTLLLTNIT